MSNKSMISNMNRDDLLQLIPAYVLGALDTDEHARVEALLVDDVEAQALEAEYREMMGDVLPLMAEARDPTPDLKNRLFDRIHEEQSNPAPAVVPLEPSTTTQDTPPAKRILRLTLFVPVAAAMILAIIGLGVVLQDFANSQTPQGVFYTLANASDSILVTVDPTDESPVRGELVVTANRDRAALRLTQLPDLESDQTFELWLIDDEGAHSAGVFMPEDNDNNEVFLILSNDRPVSQYNAFGVSVEPEGGSPLADGPSTTPIFVVSPPTGA